MVSYYFDTGIWLDIYEKRGYNGEVARKLFERIIRDNDIMFYSEMIVTELKRVGYASTEIGRMLSIAKPDHLKKVHISKGQINEARKLAKMHDISKADSLHAILSRDYQLQLISRDWDFLKLKYITLAKLPEDLA